VRCPGGNSVRAASFRFAALHETVRPHSKNGNGLTPRSSGYAPCYVAPPCFPCRTSPDAPLAGRGVSANRARAGATRPTNPGHESSTLALRTAGMKEQPTLRFSLRCEAGRRLCFRCFTQHTLCVRSTRSSFHTFILFVQTLPTRGFPSARNKGSHNVPLCAAPLLHCHAHSRGRCPDPAPPPSRQRA
jgi:hypothetical protein